MALYCNTNVTNFTA